MTKSRSCWLRELLRCDLSPRDIVIPFSCRLSSVCQNLCARNSIDSLLLSRDTSREWRLRAWLAIRSFGFPCRLLRFHRGGASLLSNDLSTMMYESFRFCDPHQDTVVSDFGHLIRRVILSDTLFWDSTIVAMIYARSHITLLEFMGDSKLCVRTRGVQVCKFSSGYAVYFTFMNW